MLLLLLGVGDGTHNLLSHGHYKLRSKTYHIPPRVQDFEDFEYSNNGSSPDIVCNADMRAAMTQLNLSARAYHRTQRVKRARTIAHLAGCEEIQSVHLAEALQYRPKLMMG